MGFEQLSRALLRIAPPKTLCDTTSITGKSSGVEHVKPSAASMQVDASARDLNRFGMSTKARSGSFDDKENAPPNDLCDIDSIKAIGVEVVKPSAESMQFDASARDGHSFQKNAACCH